MLLPLTYACDMINGIEAWRALLYVQSLLQNVALMLLLADHGSVAYSWAGTEYVCCCFWPSMHVTSWDSTQGITFRIGFANRVQHCHCHDWEIMARHFSQCRDCFRVWRLCCLIWQRMHGRVCLGSNPPNPYSRQAGSTPLPTGLLCHR